jgi:hypothetical protein
MKKRFAGLAAAAVAGAFLLTPAAAASASPASPAASTSCPDNDVCLYYESGFSGSHNTMTVSTNSLANYVFTSPGAGQGQTIKNNAESAVNHTSHTVTVWTTDGTRFNLLPAGGKGDLTYTANNLNKVTIG